MIRMPSFLALCLLVLQASTTVMAQETSSEVAAGTHQRRGLALANMCYCPSCTRAVLKRKTAEGTYTCKQRMSWLIGEQGETEYDACHQVAGVEFPDECGACDPATCNMGTVTVAMCTRRVVEMCGCKRFKNNNLQCYRNQAENLCNIPVDNRPDYMSRFMASVENRCTARL